MDCPLVSLMARPRNGRDERCEEETEEERQNKIFWLVPTDEALLCSRLRSELQSRIYRLFGRVFCFRKTYLTLYALDRH